MSGAPVPSGSYVPYNKAKRASTASITGVGRASPATQQGGSSAPAPRSPSPTKLASQPVVIHSPAPQRPSTSSSSQYAPVGAVSPPSSSRSPLVHTPQQQAWHAGHYKSASGSATPLPFQNVSPGSSPFVTPRRGQSPVKQAISTNHNPRQADSSHKHRQHDLTQSETRHGKVPYHSSFQPQGVRRDRTDEFMLNRKTKAEGKKLEEGRLGRRLEKLVALHFPPPWEAPEPPADRKSTSTLSDIAAFGQSLRGRTTKDLWSSVANSRGEVERAEQRIVAWQEDSEVTRCPICSASFGLKTRRHHCRLCGRVVCFLPPTLPVPPSTTLTAETRAPPAPVRPIRCSTFFTVEYEGQSGTAEKHPVGVVHEVETAEPESALTAFEKAPPKPKDERKKVRVCRDCLNTVLRQQMKTLPVRTPTWLKLYEVLVQLEKEIEAVLPEFQELVLGLQKPASVTNHSQPSAAAAESMRKRLLTSLASYDTLSKRVRDLPLNEGSPPGGSQDRLQRAIATRAGMFLSEKLALLRSLGDIEERASGRGKTQAATQQATAVKSLASLLADDKGGDGSSTAVINEKVGVELEASAKLSVLLEQEALVRSYVEDANARRQFEDAASLKASLNELQDEIRAIRATLA
ncbi:hypothetical protein ACM66B_005085 [Microbotryomycetes sp. NB124-2]